MRATLTYLIGPRKGERIIFDQKVISIGRAPDNDLTVGDSERRVSSHHAQITRRDDHHILLDLGSTNGTMVNGRRVVATELHHDDLIEFGAGGPLLRFNVEGALQIDGPTENADAQPNRFHGSTARPSEGASGKATAPPRSNLALVAAVVSAMSIGAIVGIVASPRMNRLDDEITFTETARLNSPAVVLIRVEFETLDGTGQVVGTEARSGSGFVIAGDGLIITNRHIVRPWEYDSSSAEGRTSRIEVIPQGRTREQAVPAEVHRLSAGAEIDIAVLRISRFSLPSTHLSHNSFDRVNQGDEVAVIGYPLGLDLLALTRDARVEPSLTTGLVSRVGNDTIQLSLRASPGTSGGPVFNRRGEVIGVITGSAGTTSELTFCIPIAAALEPLKDRDRTN